MEILELFPRGINNYIVGGLLVGLGISLPFILRGLVAGASTFFTSSWSYVLQGSFFQSPSFISSRQWRLFLVAGLVTGGYIAGQIAGPGTGIPAITEISIWKLLLGGILIGIGTRMSQGCASGHGICGNANLQPSSFVATVTFLATAVVVAYTINTIT